MFKMKTAEAVLEPMDDDNTDAYPGEFLAVLSTPGLDREGDELLQDEWLTPLPDRVQFNTDHSMSVESTVGSGVPEFTDDGDISVRGTYATTNHAQDTRALVNGKHINSVSVTYREMKSKSGGVQRELINGAFVVVPANEQAKVLASKSVDAQHDSGDAGESTEHSKDAGNPSAGPGQLAGLQPGGVEAVQAIHEAAIGLGAQCISQGGLGMRAAGDNVVLITNTHTDGAAIAVKSAGGDELFSATLKSLGLQQVSQAPTDAPESDSGSADAGADLTEMQKRWQDHRVLAFKNRELLNEDKEEQSNG